MIDAIHVGDYKTGTSWLQNRVFEQHPELVYLDLPKRFPAITRLFYELVDARDLDFDPDDIRGRFKREIDLVERSGKRLIVSREALCGDFISGEHSRRIAQRLYQVFGETKILLVIREQFSMLESIYSQHVKDGGTLPLEEFVWDPFAAKNLIDRLRHEKRIAAFVECFGAENVCVKLYDELKEDRSRFLEEIFSFIGCRDTRFLPAGTGNVNRSLTTVGASVQRVLNRLVRTEANPSSNLLPLDKAIALLLSASQRERLLRNAETQLPGAPIGENPRQFLLYSINRWLNYRLSQCCERIRLGRRIGISPQLRRRLAPLFVSDNQALVRKYGLPLEKYGWVL